MQSKIAERECGFRVSGGIYLSVPTGPNGSPVDDFLVDQPTVVDIGGMGLSSIGTKILPREYVDPKTLDTVHTHYVYDIVSRSNYPNVADFVEETRRYGVSRRISRQSDFSLLDGNSRLVLIHERAWIANANEYRRDQEDGRAWCPRDIPRHCESHFDGMCAALWWQDIEKGHAPEEDDRNAVLTHGNKMRNDQPGVQTHLQRANERAVIRAMATFRYRGLRRPDGVIPQYRHAMFMTLPIRLIEVVRDRAGGSHEAAVAAARRSGLTVEEVDR